MRFATRAAVVVLSLTLTAGLAAQSTPTTNSADEQKEAAQARELYQAQNFVGALPLYEDLHKKSPSSFVYSEGLAMCLIGAPGTDEQRQKNVARAHQLLLDAKAAGDNSNLLQVILEKLELAHSASSTPAGPVSPGAEAFVRAERAFSQGDLPAALKGYEDAMAADPKMYEAPLFAGDTEFKQGHYKEADAWYARAVAIDPDRETAYRYWGDNLMRQGNTVEAESKYIDAIIAQPYQRAPRIGLQQWADSTKAMLAPPPIQLPAPQTSGGKDKNGKDQININLDPATFGSPSSSAVLAYSMNAALWQSEKFHKTYPDEKQYRHSLAEEHESIEIALSVLKEQKIKPEKLDPTWKSLMQLDQDGMLDCWILLDNADRGIAQDYLAYRNEHRDLLHAYIAKYDVHPR